MGIYRDQNDDFWEREEDHPELAPQIIGSGLTPQVLSTCTQLFEEGLALLYSNTFNVGVCPEEGFVTVPFERSLFARLSKTNMSLVTKLEVFCRDVDEELEAMITKDTPSARLLEALTIDSDLSQQLRCVQCVFTHEYGELDVFTILTNMGLLDE